MFSGWRPKIKMTRGIVLYGKDVLGTLFDNTNIYVI